MRLVDYKFTTTAVSLCQYFLPADIDSYINTRRIRSTKRRGLLALNSDVGWSPEG